MNSGEWSVYMARCRDGSLYTGIAKDVSARLLLHNSGRGAAYTRSRRPVTLAYLETGLSRGQALSREAAIKALPRALKRRLAEAPVL
ncbi:MAG: GIY-YIG nuclease family protein [Elusimicrobia bacterium]|nr:GIY-YIG nuclease family protein [Elusimicrobiota bacterium]MDE2237036.1 GIY-YIG nuclease family protein [Elusimicrobiota bacterium]MDE2425117.1 GIY-YIG nuclease family protein [Elusimicrobiota bacterium]